MTSHYLEFQDFAFLLGTARRTACNIPIGFLGVCRLVAKQRSVVDGDHEAG